MSWLFSNKCTSEPLRGLPVWQFGCRETVCVHCFSLGIHNVLMCCYLVHLTFPVEVRANVGCKYPLIAWICSFCAILLRHKSSTSTFGRQFSQRFVEVCVKVVSRHPWTFRSTPHHPLQQLISLSFTVLIDLISCFSVQSEWKLRPPWTMVKNTVPIYWWAS